MSYEQCLQPFSHCCDLLVLARGQVRVGEVGGLPWPTHHLIVIRSSSLVHGRTATLRYLHPPILSRLLLQTRCGWSPPRVNRVHSLPLADRCFLHGFQDASHNRRRRDRRGRRWLADVRLGVNGHLGHRGVSA